MLTVHLYTADAPVASAMQPDPVSLGAMIELVCVAAEGTPPFTYTWSRDSDGTVMFTSTTSGVYSFTAASDSAGSYTCTITNPLGSDNTSVNVFVGFPPTGECEFDCVYVWLINQCILHSFTDSEPSYAGSYRC